MVAAGGALGLTMRWRHCRMAVQNAVTNREPLVHDCTVQSTADVRVTVRTAAPGGRGGGAR